MNIIYDNRSDAISKRQSVIKRMCYLVLLFVLITIQLEAQNISVKSFKSVPEDMTARVTSPVQDQNGEKCALIKIRTTQTGFVFEGDMLGIVKTIQEVGEIWVYVPSKVKKLTIKHASLGILSNYIYPEPIKEATVYFMELTTAKMTTIIEQVETPMQWLAISSNPEAADVYINNEYVGSTPYQKKMELGKYNYRLEKAMHHSSAGVIDLTETKVETLELTLNPNYGYISIETIPESGASIEIDNQLVTGLTPYLSKEMLSGKHKALVKMLMYKPKVVEFEIVDNQTTELNVELEPNFASVTVEATFEVDIYIDDEKKAVGTYSGRLMPGLHVFEAKHESYTSDRKQLELSTGQIQTIILNPIPKTGNADITTTPFGATIKLDGKEVGQTPISLKDILMGTHSLILEKRGYNKLEVPLIILENQLSSINESLSADIDFLGNNNLKETGFFVDDRDGNETGFFVDDRDGKEYRTIKIGPQVWMAENLAYLPSVSPSSYGSATQPCYYVYGYYGNKLSKAIATTNYATYGVLYNWPAAMASETISEANSGGIKGVCPEGWHLPSDAEWTILIDYLGGEDIAGGILKETGTTHWESPNTGASNESGFSALPGGSRQINGDYSSENSYAYWWSQTMDVDSNASGKRIFYKSGRLFDIKAAKDYGFSVRCIRDN